LCSKAGYRLKLYETLEAGMFDTIWLPAGTELTYLAENALVFYSLYPSDWAQQFESRP